LDAIGENESKVIKKDDNGKRKRKKQREGKGVPMIAQEKEPIGYNVEEQ